MAGLQASHPGAGQGQFPLQHSAAHAWFNTSFIALMLALGALYNLGLSLFSVAEIGFLGVSAFLLAINRRVILDIQFCAMIAMLLLVSLATLLTLDHGANPLSLGRLLMWCFVWTCIRPAFENYNPNTVQNWAIALSVGLALIHFIQIGQAFLGMSPLRLVPDSWHQAGAVRWGEGEFFQRPAVIFTEVSWYAIYQVVLLSYILLWSRAVLTLRKYSLLAIVFASLLFSGSISALAMIPVLVGCAVLLHGGKRAWKYLLITAAVMAALIAVFLAATPVGEVIQSRLFAQTLSRSFSARLVDPWVRAAAVFDYRPFLGVGIGNESRAAVTIVPAMFVPFNNMIAYIIATMGLIGVAGFTVFFMTVYRRALWHEGVLFTLLMFSGGGLLKSSFWLPLILLIGCADRARATTWLKHRMSKSTQ